MDDVRKAVSEGSALSTLHAILMHALLRAQERRRDDSQRSSRQTNATIDSVKSIARSSMRRSSGCAGAELQSVYVRVEDACSQFAREDIGNSVARDQRQNVNHETGSTAKTVTNYVTPCCSLAYKLHLIPAVSNCTCLSWR